jgi:hypothetical protein
VQPFHDDDDDVIEMYNMYGGVYWWSYQFSIQFFYFLSGGKASN